VGQNSIGADSGLTPVLEQDALGLLDAFALRWLTRGYSDAELGVFADRLRGVTA